MSNCDWGTTVESVAVAFGFWILYCRTIKDQNTVPSVWLVVTVMMVTMASTMTTPVMRRPAGSGFGSVSSLGDNALPPHCSADITLLQILYSSFSLYLFFGF